MISTSKSPHAPLTVVAAAMLTSWLAAQGPLGAPPAPPQNPVTPAKTVLGKILFWEEQLSSNNRVACGTCHTFAAGGADLRRSSHPGADGTFGTADDRFGSPGVPAADTSNAYRPDSAFGFDTQVTGRTTPTFLTGAYFADLLWDGGASGTFVDPLTNQVVIPTGGALESQALGPILNHAEMSHDGRTWAQVVNKLQASKPMALATDLTPDMVQAIQQNPTYGDLFNAAFGTTQITPVRIGMALATYERALVPNQTPFDLGTMTFQQQMGGNMFGQICATCHSGPLFSDGDYHNLGLRPIAEDNGRQGVTGIFADRGKFKTPSLRNVGLRGTFFHDGSRTTLQAVVAFYTGGGGPNTENKAPQLNNIPQIPAPMQSMLVNFVATALTDPRVAQGVAPFDRPTLLAQGLPTEGDQYGAGAAGSGGFVPRMLAGVPANLGNVDFKVGIAEAIGGASATLLISLQATTPGTQIQGVPIHADPSGLLIPLVLQGSNGVAGSGYASFQLGLPNAPSLSGLTLFGQWFVWDAGVPVAAVTPGATFQLF